MGLYIILMGVQGAGKGEQAKFIQQTYGIPQVSTGDLFRALKTRTDDLAQRVQATMAAGNLVDDDTTNEILVERLEQPDAANGVILDGYPRNAAQTAFLADYLKKKNEKITAAILLELDLYIAFKRAFGRVTDKPRNTSYNYYYKRDGVEFTFEENTENSDKMTRFPPRLVAKLKDTGEVIERRPDDADAAAVVKRIDLYMAETMPLLPEFEKLGVLHKVNAEQSVEQVSAAIKALIDRAK